MKDQSKTKAQLIEELAALRTRVAQLQRARAAHEKVAQALQAALDESRQCGTEIAALLKASRAVLRYRDFAEASRHIFDACKNSIGASAGYVALLTKDGTENDVLFLDSGGLPCTVDPSLPMPVRGLRAEAYRTGKVVYENRFSESEWTRFMPEGHVTLHNAMFAPLMIDSKAVGLLGLANKPGGFTDNDAHIAQALGELVSIALLNSRTFEFLEQSETRLRSIVETAHDGIITADVRGSIAFWNRAAQSIFGYTAEEIVGRPVTTIIPERFHNAYARELARVASTGKGRLVGKTVEMIGLRKDGSEFPAELSLAVWRTTEGMFLTALLRDISERKHAEEELQRYRHRLEEVVEKRTAELRRVNEELRTEIAERKRAEKAVRDQSRILETFFKHTITPLAFLDRDFNFIRVNEAYADADERDASEFPGRNHFELYPSDARAIFERVVQTKTPFETVERPFTYPDHPEWGTTYWDWSLVPILDAEGEVEFLVLSLKDVTERKQAQQELERSRQELRELAAHVQTAREQERAEVAREIHDELGQVLTGLEMDLAWLHTRLAENDEGSRHALLDKLDAMSSLVDTTIESVQRIAAELRPGVLDDFGLLAAIEWQAQEFEKRAGIPCTLLLAIEDIHLEDAASTALFRIVQEALTNVARHAEATTVAISLKQEGDTLHLKVKDNGKGIAEDAMTGSASLGILGMRERARFLGGEVSITGLAKKGTTVEVTVPLRESAANPVPTTKPRQR